MVQPAFAVSRNSVQCVESSRSSLNGDLEEGREKIHISRQDTIPVLIRLFTFPSSAKPARPPCGHKYGPRPWLAVCRGTSLAAGVCALFFTLSAFAQRAEPTPVVVQPGAPGSPTRILPPSTKGRLPPRSSADVEFMQGMIRHHAQAVEMTAMIASHTENKGLRSLGARISSSQSDEIRLMKRWLAARGETVPTSMPGMPGMDMSNKTASNETASNETTSDTSNHMSS